MAKKKYSVNWEDGEAVSFEINGILYSSLDEISNPKDQRKMMAIVDAAQEDEEFEQDLPDAAPATPSFKIENIILSIFSGVAALMILIAAISSWSAIATIQKEKSAPGRVVDVVLRRTYVNEQDRIIEEYYYPVVDFTTDDGRRRSLQMSVGSNTPEFELGDEVIVLYDPEHPLNARIKSFGSSANMWILPGITGVLGLAFLGAVLIVRSLIRSEMDTSFTQPGV